LTTVRWRPHYGRRHQWLHNWGPYGVPLSQRDRHNGFCFNTCLACGLRKGFFTSMVIPFYWVEITAGVWAWAQVYCSPCPGRRS
jgi:hypothetical protein